ncbi:MAG: M50 family metallopeptidase [Coriobacteriales bacterium]|jgi:regulator of sigma E protease
MVDVLLTIFWGIVLLSIVVVIHEGGHYLSARAFKVRVTEFMVGLPGPSIGFRPKKSRTRFGVTAVPLGGYARIAGMDEWKDETNFPRAVEYIYRKGSITESEADEMSGELGFDLADNLDSLYEWGTVERKKSNGEMVYYAPQVDDFELGEPRVISNSEAFIRHERSQTYISLPWWKRMIILFAGPGANLVTAIIVVTITLALLGTTMPTLTISDAPDGYPAAVAGMQAGDTITAINGQEVDSWTEFTQTMSELSPGDEVQITFTRDGEEQTVSIEAATGSDGNAVIGVTAGSEHVSYSVLEALGESCVYIGQVTVAILELINPFTTMQIVSQSTSIVGISVIAKQAADLGWINFMWLAAVISISIGLMNLLPLMPLDGGRMVVETIQRIRHKVSSPAFINSYTTLGIVFVMFLFIVVTFQDVSNIATGRLPW